MGKYSGVKVGGKVVMGMKYFHRNGIPNHKKPIKVMVWYEEKKNEITNFEN